MNNMEQMQTFIKGLKSQTYMLLDVFARGIICQMTAPQVKNLIEKMCMNEYCSKSERSVKMETVGIPKGMLSIDTYTALLAHIKLLNKKIVENNLVKANMSLIQALRCDFNGEEHVNGRYLLEGTSDEV